MKKCSTMELRLLISKSQFLQDLFIRLPDVQLRDVLISPRQELVDKLKKKIHARPDMDN